MDGRCCHRIIIMSRKYNVTSYGCQMNLHDADRIGGILDESGWSESEGLEDADAVILLTCCVRESAEKKFYGKLSSLKRFKEVRPLIIAVGGCLAQKEGVRLLEKAPYVDLVFGTHKYPYIAKLLEEELKNKKCVTDMDGLHIAGLPCRRKDPFRAWVTITHGCDNYCSYCIVPFVRGREISRPIREVLDEVEKHVSDGVKEINLLGQNVNSYGRGQEDDVSFAQLLRMMGERFPDVWVRFATSHPRDFDDQIVKAIKETPNVCEYVHLPLQAGADRVLEAMNRGYTSEEYLEKARALRETVKGVSLGTDLIVGFPGERESDFKKTLEMVELCSFDSAFTFLYNIREGTAAARMPDDVPSMVKQDRLERLMRLTRHLTKESLRKEVGKVKLALVYGISRKDPGQWAARTRDNKLVHFPCGERELDGKTVKLSVTGSGSWSLRGDIMEVVG
jgi:tRNA-2-methylthio-N6-dimethylallyladenosine synthase